MTARPAGGRCSGTDRSDSLHWASAHRGCTLAARRSHRAIDVLSEVWPRWPCGASACVVRDKQQLSPRLRVQLPCDELYDWMMLAVVRRSPTGGPDRCGSASFAAARDGPHAAPSRTEMRAKTARAIRASRHGAQRAAHHRPVRRPHRRSARGRVRRDVELMATGGGGEQPTPRESIRYLATGRAATSTRARRDAAAVRAAPPAAGFVNPGRADGAPEYETPRTMIRGIIAELRGRPGSVGSGPRTTAQPTARVARGSVSSGRASTPRAIVRGVINELPTPAEPTPLRPADATGTGDAALSGQRPASEGTPANPAAGLPTTRLLRITTPSDVSLAPSATTTPSPEPGSAPTSALSAPRSVGSSGRASATPIALAATPNASVLGVTPSFAVTLSPCVAATSGRRRAVCI